MNQHPGPKHDTWHDGKLLRREMYPGRNERNLPTSVPPCPRLTSDLMAFPRGSLVDGLTKLCLLDSKVGLQLVKSTEHVCALSKGAAAAVEALCMLQDREEGTAGSMALHLPSSVLPVPENRGRDDSIVTAFEKVLINIAAGHCKCIGRMCMVSQPIRSTCASVL